MNQRWGTRHPPPERPGGGRQSALAPSSSSVPCGPTGCGVRAPLTHPYRKAGNSGACHPREEPETRGRCPTAGPRCRPPALPPRLRAPPPESQLTASHFPRVILQSFSTGEGGSSMRR